MLEKRLTEITSRLDYVFKSTNSVAEEEIKSHLAKYLCILTSGYVEESLKIIIEYYSSINAHKNITNYISISTKSLTNLNAQKIENLLLKFNRQWGEKFSKTITAKEKDAIDSVIANRNQIAHGRNVGVSYVNVREWYLTIKGLIDSIRLIISV